MSRWDLSPCQRIPNDETLTDNSGTFSSAGPLTEPTRGDREEVARRQIPPPTKIVIMFIKLGVLFYLGVAYSLSAEDPRTDLVGVLRPHLEFNAEQQMPGMSKSHRKQLEGPLAASYKNLEDMVAPLIQELWVEQLKDRGIRAVALMSTSATAAKAEPQAGTVTCFLATTTKSWRSFPSMEGGGVSFKEMLTGRTKSPDLDAAARQARLERHVEARFSLQRSDGSSVLGDTTVQKHTKDADEDLWAEVAGYLVDRVKGSILSDNLPLTDALPVIQVTGGAKIIVKQTIQTKMDGKESGAGAQEQVSELNAANGEIASQGKDFTGKDGCVIYDAKSKKLIYKNDAQKRYFVTPLQALEDAYSKTPEWNESAKALQTPQATTLADGSLRFTYQGPEGQSTVDVKLGDRLPAWDAFREAWKQTGSDSMALEGALSSMALPFLANAELLKQERAPVEIVKSTTMTVFQQSKYSVGMETRVVLTWSEPANPAIFAIGIDYKVGSNPMLSQWMQ